MPRIVLVHGAATTAAIWDRVVRALDGRDVVAVQRPSTGSLDAEMEWLAPHAEGAFVVGASGGATLCLALAASGVRLAGGIAHEPAVGSLVPDLLEPVIRGYDTGGYEGMGRALYGGLWEASMAPHPAAVGRDLGMFRTFEPATASRGQGAVLVTTGERSPEPRFRASSLLASTLGYDTATVANCAHFVAYENPVGFAQLIALTADAVDESAAGK